MIHRRFMLQGTAVLCAPIPGTCENRGLTKR